ncbi:hypothetical protein CROQUDRAFT_650084 [Cronartium quercuum f. sp. fusiforme G11]|uniref:Uncharacterized protein n=1 Tax=Cronartium quercuum f. sp. fusiforme G11 TaxID=708437 RepID=A0A9P6NRI7_9BASI|nr:hypothetical protein CROQUDRAFT_650084 [Cronartium quercuum f. sp. fusiforme G11]
MSATPAESVDTLDFPYRELIGSLNHAAIHTRLDIPDLTAPLSNTCFDMSRDHSTSDYCPFPVSLLSFMSQHITQTKGGYCLIT